MMGRAGLAPTYPTIPHMAASVTQLRSSCVRDSYRFAQPLCTKPDLRRGERRPPVSVEVANLPDKAAVWGASALRMGVQDRPKAR
jgi:hypothetical protein